MKQRLLTGVAIASMGFAQAAFAQTEATGASAAPGEAAQAQLQDIVVTAQRRSENLQRAAVAVSAVSGDTLLSAGITNPTGLTAIVPALQIAPAAGPYNLFYLRGVGNFNGNAFSDSAVAFNADGVFIGRPSSTTGFFYDLERVEVVKGPQGTLYGRNATGGAINVISKKPELHDFGASGSIEYGNYDAVRLDGMLNLPVGDRAAFRVAGIYVRHDGYLNDGTDDQKDWGGRASFRFDASDTLKIVAVADYFHQGGAGVGSTPLASVNGQATPATLSVDDRIGFLSPEGQAVYSAQHNSLLGRNFYAIGADQYPFQKNNYWGVSATVDWTTPIGTLTIVPGHREGSLDYRNFQPGFYVRQKEKTDQSSIEARFATPDDKPLRALIGAFYYKENTRDPIVAYIHQSNATFENGIKLATESKALFGRLTYAVTPNIRFTVGARQTWENKTFAGNLLSLSRICAPPPFTACPAAPQIPYDPNPPALTAPGQVIIPTLGPPPYGGLPAPATAPALIQVAAPISTNRDDSFKKLTWRVGAEWDIGPRNLLYVSYETGFKAGGFFFSHDEGIFRPETIRALTIGSKNRFLDNRLQLNVELFDWRYKDQQISHLTFDSVGTAIFGTENVGRATFRGAEVEARLAVSATTMLNADIQYLDAKYNNFIYTTPNQNGGFNNGTGCPNAAAPAVVYTINCSAKRPPNAPEWTANIGGQQRYEAGFGDFVFDARAHYQSRTLAGLEFLPIENQKGYWLVDAGLTFYAPGRRYFIEGFINNMFDKTVVAMSFPVPFGSFFSTGLRPPRTFGVRAGFKF